MRMIRRQRAQEAREREARELAVVLQAFDDYEVDVAAAAREALEAPRLREEAILRAEREEWAQRFRAAERAIVTEWKFSSIAASRFWLNWLPDNTLRWILQLRRVWQLVPDRQKEAWKEKVESAWVHGRSVPVEEVHPIDESWGWLPDDALVAWVGHLEWLTPFWEMISFFSRDEWALTDEWTKVWMDRQDRENPLEIGGRTPTIEANVVWAREAREAWGMISAVGQDPPIVKDGWEIQEHNLLAIEEGRRAMNIMGTVEYMILFNEGVEAVEVRVEGEEVEEAQTEAGREQQQMRRNLREIRGVLRGMTEDERDEFFERQEEMMARKGKQALAREELTPGERALMEAKFNRDRDRYLEKIAAVVEREADVRRREVRMREIEVFLRRLGLLEEGMTIEERQRRGQMPTVRTRQIGARAQ